MSHLSTPEPIPEHGLEMAPDSFWKILLRIGPGLILVGNIVGSGELIATPLLSAQTGYVFLWLILFSCFIKVFFQIEIGRYAVSEGQTTLASLNTLPGPRLGVHWLLWYWLIVLAAGIVQQGAMAGGVAQALRIALPLFGSHSEAVWAILTGSSIIALLLIGRYRTVEITCLILVSLFTLLTVYTVIEIQFNPTYALSMQNVIDGFSFRLPDDPKARQGAIGTALMAFGITGVGAAELIIYPYWCLEKGYGRFVGRRDASPHWAERARSWIRVMHVDAWFCMALFTVATVAFYLLGAAILHPHYLATGELPEKTHMVERLSYMYLEVFGTGARYVFLVGAFAVLYSTFFVSTASNARMLTDWLGIVGWIRRDHDEGRRFWVSLFCVLFPVISTTTYLLFPQPTTLVKISGIAQAIMLPMIGFAVLYFAYRRTDVRIRGGKLWYATLWISFLLICVASGWMAYSEAASWWS